MKLHLSSCFLLLALFVLCIDARKTSGSRRGGSSGSTFSRKGTSKPQQTSQQTHGGGSNPGTIGWNVPKQQSTNVKPSAPVSDSVSKTSATNVQSGYQPSGGYGHQTGGSFGQSGTHYNPQPASHGYNPPASHGYNPPVNQGYPSSGGYGGYNSHGAGQGYQPQSGGYHPPASGGYHPQGGGVGQPYQPYNNYNPSLGHSNQHGVGYNPPVAQAPQTIYVQSAGQPYKPGIGQIAKEAFVYAGVSAGVNAAVNRILPGGIYGNHGSSGSSGTVHNAPPAVTHTEITYNNYYNNGTAVDPAAPGSNAQVNPAPAAIAQPAAVAQPAVNGQPAAVAQPAVAPVVSSNAPTTAKPNEDAMFPSPLGFVITKAEIEQLTEDLLSKDVNNAGKWVTMKLQGQKMDDSVKDDAPEPLLAVKEEAWSIPTVRAVLNLHDNYELDVRTKEEVSSEERREEDTFLDLALEGEVMKATMKFLADKGYVPNDAYEFKDMLKRMWFSQFKRMEGDASSSGFETVFLAEKFDSEIIGLHNWIYYAKMETSGKLNYLGYIKEATLGDKGAIVKVRSSLNDIVQPVTSLFVGTSPELEMALYTMCFYTRPNYPCPIKLGGKEFVIIANRANYFGKDILVSAYPDL